MKALCRYFVIIIAVLMLAGCAAAPLVNPDPSQPPMTDIEKVSAVCSDLQATISMTKIGLVIAKEYTAEAKYWLEYAEGVRIDACKQAMDTAASGGKVDLIALRNLVLEALAKASEKM